MRMMVSVAAGQMQQNVLLWGGILIGLAILLVGMIYYVKKKVLSDGGSNAADAGFSLSDLRAMRDRGEITAEEYERTRANVIAKVKTMMKKEEAEDAEGGAPGSAG